MTHTKENTDFVKRCPERDSVPSLMKTSWLFFALLNLGILICVVACHQDVHHAIVHSAKPYNTAAVVDRPRPPTIYNGQMHTARLTPGQFSDIEKTLIAQHIQESVWFVYVSANNEDEYRAVVYLKPEKFESRVWRGQSFSMWRSDWANALSAAFRMPIDDTFELTNYCYVSPTRAKLGSTALPRKNEIPFRLEDDLSDSDLVEIIDLYRTRDNSPIVLENGGLTFGVDKQNPIMSIRLQGELVELKSGTVEGPLCGAGQIVTFEKHEGAWRIGTVSLWVS
jgi:hypothetical protein